MSPPQSDKVVLRSNNRRSQVVQVILGNNHEWNWLVQCLLTIWQMILHFSMRVLPDTAGYGRRSGELLEILEVSPPVAVKDTPAIAVQGAAEQG